MLGIAISLVLRYFYYSNRHTTKHGNETFTNNTFIKTLGEFRSSEQQFHLIVL